MIKIILFRMNYIDHKYPIRDVTNMNYIWLFFLNSGYRVRPIFIFYNYLEHSTTNVDKFPMGDRPQTYYIGIQNIE